MLDLPRTTSLASELTRIGQLLVANNKLIERSELEQLDLCPRSFDNISTLSLDLLCDKFDLTDFDRDVILLCLGVQIYSYWKNLCASASGDRQRNYVTFNLALSLFGEDNFKAVSDTAPMLYWGLIKIQPDLDFSYSKIAIDKQIYQYLLNNKFNQLGLLNKISLLRIKPNLPPSHQKIARNLLLQWMQKANKSNFLVQLLGKDLSSKKAIAQTIFSEFDNDIYTLDVRSLLNSFSEIDNFPRKLAREWILNDAILLLELDELDSLEPQLKFSVFKFIKSLECPLIVSSRERLYFENIETITYQIDLPSTSEQKLLWKQSLKEISSKLNDDIDRIVSHFSFSSETIETLSNQLKILNNNVANQTENETFLNGSNSNVQILNGYDSNGDKPIEMKYAKFNPQPIDNKDMGSRLWEICRTYARPQLEDLAQRINSKVSWTDLVIPEREHNTLKEIALHVRSRTKVYENWGMARQSSRGLGISALFAGSSGTGKTLAAEVLANELNLDVYRVDLSTVVSKYIGETEKNLRKIFDAAENCGVILLFDEADAIFGKRTEVKDSHDRYANMEVSYLLQRIETYRGLAILTTNLKQDIDRAFLRRIRFIVKFEFPDAQMRQAIWQRVFPKETPTQDLDYKKLAKLNVTGGNIRNIAIKAAFLAADCCEKVQMKHILEATHRECLKLERVLCDSEIYGWVTSE
ncbi:MAG: ATP-binding protein [Prochloraceae cyanobacterium]